MPAAARVTDKHQCSGNKPGHAGDPILPEGEPTVLIGGKPAARAGDSADCPLGKAVIEEGEPTVLIGHQEAARLGDPMAHGGHVAAGCRTVMIGSALQADALREASKTGTALSEKKKPAAKKGAPHKAPPKKGH